MNDDVLFQRISNILLKQWDPIGINHYPSAKDEYDTYARDILRLPKETKSIQSYLEHARIHAMGLNKNSEMDSFIAQECLKALEA